MSNEQVELRMRLSTLITLLSITAAIPLGAVGWMLQSLDAHAEQFSHPGAQEAIGRLDERTKTIDERTREITNTLKTQQQQNTEKLDEILREQRRANGRSN